jgi:RND family efflux transporter MFP subunit
MNKYFIFAWSVAVSLLLASCGASTTTHADDEGDDDHDHEGGGHPAYEIAFTKAQAKAADLRIETTTAAPFHSAFKVGGQIQAPQGDETTIAATAAGVLSFANGSITEGVEVRAGETLATVSSKNIQDGDPALKAKIAYETAEKAYRRAERLAAENIVSTKELEAAKANYETAKAVYQAQSGNMTAQGVRIPVTKGGYLKQLLVSQGEYVAVGQPIAVVSQNRRLQLKAMVPESRFAQLRSVNSANFIPAYDAESTFRLENLNGKLISYGKSATDNSAFIPVIFEFDNVGNLIPGSYAEVYLLGQSVGNVISVPLSAVTEEQGLYFVYVKIEEEAFEKRQVELGDTDGERVVIRSGLKEGEPVVVHGAYNVKLASVSTAIPHGHSH